MNIGKNLKRLESDRPLNKLTKFRAPGATSHNDIINVVKQLYSNTKLSDLNQIEYRKLITIVPNEKGDSENNYN